MRKSQQIINNKCVSQEQLQDLLIKNDEVFFSFISSFYALKPWTENDLLDVYNLLKKSNKFLHNTFTDSISITATGGELNTRTLYVTPVVSILLSAFKSTFLQGNTAISGCGCGNFAEADIMKELGIEFVNQTNVSNIFHKDNFAFLHALTFHSLLGNYHEIRANLGFRDIFKVASSLADPFLSSNLFICVYSEEQLRYSAAILAKRKPKHAVLVTGLEGIDEASLKGKTILADIKNNNIAYIEFLPSMYGFDCIDSLSEVGSVSTLTDECNIIVDILKNHEQREKTQFCILNAGIALYAADIVKSIEKGIELARQTIESGQAYNKYLSLINH
ncbi:MAG: hypothetical protein LBH32_04025 [Dysgonamonadaceae bacterium]|jgi:anthranilate phosphoribosyltransferase|nr:hypothetical protein [Dysgonamonadaceae bacterium]